MQVPLFFFVSMYRNRQYLDGRSLNRTQCMSEATQTDANITNSTGKIYHDLNRSAVHEVRGVIRQNRVLTKQIRRRLANADAAQALPDLKLQQKQFDAASNIYHDTHYFGHRTSASNTFDNDEARAAEETVPPLVETDSEVRLEGWERAWKQSVRPSLEAGNTIPVMPGDGPFSRDHRPRSSHQGTEFLELQTTDMELSDRVKGGAGNKKDDTKKKKKKKTHTLLGANKRMEHNKSLLNTLKNLDAHTEARKSEQREKRQKETMADVCYHCKQPGHWKMHCPELAKVKKEVLLSECLPEQENADNGDRAVTVSIASDMIHGYPDTPWGRGMKLRKTFVPTTLTRIPGIPHFDDKCYYCGGKGHWKTMQSEQICPLWLDENAPPNADKYTGVEAGLGAASSEANIERVRRGKQLWQKATTKAIIGTVLTAQLEAEKAQQIVATYAFLVKDYQEKYYYFECIFLIEKLILTGFLIFIDQGTIAQAYVATITAFAFCVIQTKYMPYALHQDNILKQLCEVQLLMTLLVSIILRTDLEEDALGETGYDIILMAVNILMVPGFMMLFASIGLWAVTCLLWDLLRKNRKIMEKTNAIHELSKGITESVLARELKKNAVEQIRQANIAEFKRKQAEAAAQSEKARQKVTSDRDKDDLSLAVAALVATSEDNVNLGTEVGAVMENFSRNHTKVVKMARATTERLEQMRDLASSVEQGHHGAQQHVCRAKTEAKTKFKLHVDNLRGEQVKKDNIFKNTVDSLQKSLQLALQRRNEASKAHTVVAKEAEALRGHIVELEENVIADLKKQMHLDRVQSARQLQALQDTHQAQLQTRLKERDKVRERANKLEADHDELNLKYNIETGTKTGVIAQLKTTDQTLKQQKLHEQEVSQLRRATHKAQKLAAQNAAELQEQAQVHKQVLADHQNAADAGMQKLAQDIEAKLRSETNARVQDALAAQSEELERKHVEQLERREADIQKLEQAQSEHLSSLKVQEKLHQEELDKLKARQSKNERKRKDSTEDDMARAIAEEKKQVEAELKALAVEHAWMGIRRLPPPPGRQNSAQ